MERIEVWKLRWAGWDRGKKRIYREDGSFFYDDPSKYQLQYTEEEKSFFQ